MWLLAILPLALTACSANVPPPIATVVQTSNPPTSSPPRTPLPPGVFENEVLGYRITLPMAFRKASSSIAPGMTAGLGGDVFTNQTIDDAKSDCQTGAGSGIGGQLRYMLVTVHVQRNPDGLSAARWAPTYPPNAHALVEPAIIAGYDAARVVQGGEVGSYVINSNARIYVLGRTGNTTAQLLADAAETFQAITPAAFPSPTVPSQTPREGATQLAQRLSQAFAAQDADTIAGLMTDCRMVSLEKIDRSFLGTDHFPSRYAPDFITALRGHFARGELSVTVDPAVQEDPVSGQFSITSQWREADRTTRIDLLLGEREGRWQWHSATHYFASVTSRCIRSPWVASTC